MLIAGNLVDTTDAAARPKVPAGAWVHGRNELKFGRVERWALTLEIIIWPDSKGS